MILGHPLPEVSGEPGLQAEMILAWLRAARPVTAEQLTVAIQGASQTIVATAVARVQKVAQ